MKKFFSIVTVCAVFALGACNHASTDANSTGADTTKKAMAPMAKDTSKKAMPADTTMKKDTTKKM